MNTGSVLPVDRAPITELDHENNHDIIIDGENHPVLPCTKSVDQGILMAFQFFDVRMRIRFVCESRQFVFDPLFIGLWQAFEITLGCRSEDSRRRSDRSRQA